MIQPVTPGLRDYQRDALEGLRRECRNRPVLCLPTGAGKTIVFAELIRKFRKNTNGRVLVLAHRRELIHQAAAKFAIYGIEPGIIMSGSPHTDAPVQVASVQTLVRRTPPPADLVVIDEAHHAVSDSYQDALAPYANALLVGATATPFRLDGQGLGEVFHSIVAPTSVAALCAAGHLLEPFVLAPPGPDMHGVRTNAGDYSSSGAAERMAPLTGDIVAHWLKYARGRRTICFAVNVEHSLQIVQQFRDAGVAAAHCDGNAPYDERQDILDRLRSGTLHIVSNCALWGEGVDMPELEVAILARPTKSLCLHLQQIGRIMRPMGEKKALVLDHAGNHHRHGAVTEAIEYSLDARVTRSAPSHTTCKACYAILPAGTQVCPQCGALLVATDRDAPELPESDDGELIPFTAEDKFAYYRDCVANASASGYKLGWAKVRYKERFGGWARGVAAIDETYACPGHQYRSRDWGVVCDYCLRKKQVIEFRERNEAARVARAAAERESNPIGNAPATWWED